MQSYLDELLVVAFACLILAAFRAMYRRADVQPVLAGDQLIVQVRMLLAVPLTMRIPFDSITEHRLITTGDALLEVLNGAMIVGVLRRKMILLRRSSGRFRLVVISHRD